jgi:hypothetical protein
VGVSIRRRPKRGLGGIIFATFFIRDESDGLIEVKLSTNFSNAAKPSADGGKKPYHKPAVRHERVFETMALHCGKISATQSSCKFHRKAS